MRCNLKLYINVPDPPPRKQPDNGESASMERGKAVTINVENEERISAHKSNASNDTSTSTWSNVHLQNNTDSSKENPGAIVFDQKTGNSGGSPVLILPTENSQVHKLREDAEKNHWEPPFQPKMVQE